MLNFYGINGGDNVCRKLKKKIVKLDKYLIELPSLLVLIAVVYLGVVLLIMNSIEVSNSIGEAESLLDRVVRQIVVGEMD